MRLVIIGNGAAGRATASLVRRARPDVGIVIYSQQPHHYYPRPRLMDVLAGSVPPERIISHTQDGHREHRIRGFLGQRIEGLEPDDGGVVRGMVAVVRRLIAGNTPISEEDDVSLQGRFDLWHLVRRGGPTG